MQNSPSILLFKNEGNKITAEAFEKALYQFVEAQFGAFTKSISYGDTNYSAPDRDNQFHDSYVRQVYQQVKMENGEELEFNVL
ncbi:MAG: hypothetical protein GY810_27240 [Aureispira sp.]|nr:hypothetical protein [Aureispira sp.]